MIFSRKAETLCVIGCGRGFSTLARGLGLKIKKGKSHIAVIGERQVKGKVSGDVVFFPDTSAVSFSAVFAVSAGMGEKSTLCFSSIGDTKALLCVRRKVDFFGSEIEPREVEVDIIKNLTVYENMVFGFLSHFL